MIRPAGAQDLPFLRDMLRHAYYARWGTEADVPLERYVAGWGRPGDEALVAIDEFQPVGAAWYRLFEQDEPGYGFVDEADAGADDRDRAQPARPGARRAASLRAPRAGASSRVRGGQPQRRARQPGDPPVRAPRLHEGRRARRRVGDAGDAFLAPRNDLPLAVHAMHRLWHRERGRPQVLRRMRQRAPGRLPVVRSCELARSEVLRRVRLGAGRRHSHTGRTRCTRRRAQARLGPLRRSGRLHVALRAA